MNTQRHALKSGFLCPAGWRARLAVLGLLFWLALAATAAARLSLVSVTWLGQTANGDCFAPALSADGRFMAFTAGASNLVPKDNNGLWDVFVYDRLTRELELISRNAAGESLNGSSSRPAISADGRYVVYFSDATDIRIDNGGIITMYPGDQVFRHDRTTRQNLLISINPAGNASANQGCVAMYGISVSADGNRVAFTSLANNLTPGDSNGLDDVFVRDVARGQTYLISSRDGYGNADGYSRDPVLNLAGSQVLFSSAATNLEPGLNDNNNYFDVYLAAINDTPYTLWQPPRCVSRPAAGLADGFSNYPSFSGDGQMIAFVSAATNLIPGLTPAHHQIYLCRNAPDEHDFLLISADRSAQPGDNDSYYPCLNRDGRRIIFKSWAHNMVDGDTGGCSLILYDRDANIMQQLAPERRDMLLLDPPAISADGRQAAFAWSAPDFSFHIYAWSDPVLPVERINLAEDGSQADDSSGDPLCSADGRFVTYSSRADNLVTSVTLNGWSQIFRYDRYTRSLRLISARDDQPGDAVSGSPAMSGDGRIIAFASSASNLAENRITSGKHILLWADSADPDLYPVSITPAADGASDNPCLARDALFIAFNSGASNLVPGDGNGKHDVFVADMQTWDYQRVSVSSAGDEGNGDSFGPRISAGGRWVAFTSYATNLVPEAVPASICQVYIHDRITGITRLVSKTPGGVPADAGAYLAALSPDGRYALLNSAATNLDSEAHTGLTNPFRVDLWTGRISLAVKNLLNQAPGDGSYGAALDNSGRWTGFLSAAAGLIAADSNGVQDFFLRDSWTGKNTRPLEGWDGSEPDAATNDVSLAGSRFLVAGSAATNLVRSDSNNLNDIFFLDLSRYHPWRLGDLDHDGQVTAADIAIHVNFLVSGAWTATSDPGETLLTGRDLPGADSLVKQLVIMQVSSGQVLPFVDRQRAMALRTGSESKQ